MRDDRRRSSGDGGGRGEPDEGDGDPMRSLERRFLSTFAGVVAERGLGSTSGVEVGVDMLAAHLHAIVDDTDMSKTWEIFNSRLPLRHSFAQNTTHSRCAVYDRRQHGDRSEHNGSSKPSSSSP